MKANFISGLDGARSFCSVIRNKKEVYIYPFFSDKNADKAVLIGLSFCDGEDCYYLPCNHHGYNGNIPIDIVGKIFEYMNNKDVVLYFYDSRNTVRILENKTGFSFDDVKYKDVQVSYWLLDTSKKQPSLWDAIEDLEIPVRSDIKEKMNLFEGTRIDYVDPSEYNLYLCFFSALVCKVNEKVRKVSEEKNVHSEIDMECLYPLTQIEKTTTRFDEECFNDLKKKNEKEINELLDAICYKTGFKVNLEKSNDIMKALRILEIDNVSFEKNVVSIETLEDVSDRSKLTKRQKEALSYIIDLKKLVSYKRKCIDNLNNEKNKNRLRFHYNNCMAATGRISSGMTGNSYFSRINIMNISRAESKDWYVRKATEEEIKNKEDILGWYFSEEKMEGDGVYIIEGKSTDKNIRQCFLPEKDSFWVVVDADSQELRVISNLYKEKYWTDLFLENKDIYKEYAINLFGKENYSSEKRKLVKEFIYGLNYGMAEETFINKHPEIDRKILVNFVTRLKKSIPNILLGQEKEKQYALKTGYIRSGFYRKRKFSPEMANDYRFNSVVKNTPIQGIAADITKMQMCKLWKDILSKREDVKCLFNIYDEFNFSVPRENTVNLIKNILDTMKVTVKGWQVPFTCSCEIGKTWGTTFKFKYDDDKKTFVPSIKL